MEINVYLSIMEMNSIEITLFIYVDSTGQCSLILAYSHNP